jgi:phage-related protein
MYISRKNVYRPESDLTITMAEAPNRRPLIWMGRSRKDIGEFPERVKGELGYGLDLAQSGEKHENAKPLKGFKGAGVLELVENFDGDTYRAVYTIEFAEVVYVLHVFQKKSKTGIATPKTDIDLIERRLKLAQEHYQENYDSTIL